MNHNGRIPFVDLVTLQQEVEPELVAVFRAALETAGFVGGPLVEKFEREFAAFCKTKYCAGVGSGTDALRFALSAAGVQRGDLVITVPLTFIATTEAISQVGAQPEFVDIDPSTFTMDPDKLRHYLENRCSVDAKSGRCMHRKLQRPVTAVVPVHLYGHTADMDAILSIAEEYNLLVIEDACQAHGAEYFSRNRNGWRRAGSMGHAAAFSFYPGKNLGACGEGGAVTTDDEKIHAKVSMLRDHGQAKKYYHSLEGYNGRLDAIQAGILSVKLQRLSEWNGLRRQAAERYASLLSQVDHIGVPHQADWARPVWHLYVIRTSERDGLKAWLAESGVDTAIHYPIPLHLQDAYRSLNYAPGSFPIAETVASEILSLPMYPHLRESQQQKILQALVDFSLREIPLPGTR